MKFQSGQCHFGSSPRHLLGRVQRELPADTAVSHKCMQEGDQEEEEQLPLFYQVPLPRLLAWSRWWHIAARALLIAYQKKVLGIDWKLLEASSRCSESSSRPCQTQVGQGSRQIAPTVERLRTKVIAGKLLCSVYYGRCRELTPYST